MARTGQTIAGHSLQTMGGTDALTEIWRAVHLDLGLTRQIRVLRPEAREHAAEWVAMAQEQRRLIHPCRLQVYDVVKADGLPAVILECVNGPSLQTWSKARPRSITELLRVFAEVADALGMAHDVGIVHGAVDARRVWMQPGSGSFSPRVDLAVGTLGNAVHLCPIRAPEQITDGRVDLRTDLYLLGATFFEILARRPGQALPPTGTLPELRTDAPLGLAHILSALLEPDPANRPESIDEVRDALIEVARQDPAPAPATWRETVQIDPILPKTSIDEDPRGRWVAMVAAAALLGSVCTAAWLAYTTG
jgi:serine/threonine protein kinase